MASRTGLYTAIRLTAYLCRYITRNRDNIRKSFPQATPMLIALDALFASCEAFLDAADGLLVIGP